MHNPYGGIDYGALLSGRHILLAGEGEVIRCAEEAFTAQGAKVYRIPVPSASDDPALREAMEKAARDGGFDGLVYWTGLCRDGGMHETDAAAVCAEMQRGFGGFAVCMRAVLPGFMAGRYGTVAAGISDLAVSAVPGESACAAVSGAILSYVRAAAVEYARYGIRANCVMTGYSLAEAGDERIRRVGAAQAEDDFARFPALHRRALPEDAVNALLFLLSDMSNAITGEAIPADGGLNVIGHSQVWNRPEGPAFTMSLPKRKEAR